MDDRDGAVREVAQVYERIKLQQPLLLHSSSSASSQSPSPSATATTTRLAHSLLGQALRALNVALSVMNQPQQGPPVPPPPTEPKAERQPEPTTTTRGKRPRSSSSSSTMEGRTNKKKPSSSWVDFTTVPYEDGYEWRKYGEKKINGAGHTRSYFRCTYRDDTGCRATKHVQQRDDDDGSSSGDPPVFQVTYNGQHTCSSSNAGASGGECTVAKNNSGAAMVIVKQEPTAALPPPPPPPPPVAGDPYSALRFDRKPPPPCQGLVVPVGTLGFCGTDVRDCHGGGAVRVLPSMSTTSSCISGESSDEYSAGGGGEDMAARMAGVEAPADDVLFNDFELFLLCNSFKDY